MPLGCWLLMQPRCLGPTSASVFASARRRAAVRGSTTARAAASASGARCRAAATSPRRDDTVRARARTERTHGQIHPARTVARSEAPGGEVIAVEAVRRALEAAAQMRGRVPVEVDPTHVAAAIRSERLLRLDGRPLPGFAPMSRFWRASDGWVRTHANYRWHQDALLAALATNHDGFARAIATLPAAEVDARVYGAGGLAVAVRTATQWRALAGDPAPLIDTVTIPGVPPRPARRLRVLDLTRVIAGPVGTRCSERSAPTCSGSTPPIDPNSSCTPVRRPPRQAQRHPRSGRPSPTSAGSRRGHSRHRLPPRSARPVRALPKHSRTATPAWWWWRRRPGAIFRVRRPPRL